jgi:hypothetical protein
MEFEARIAGFSTGLFILGSYILLFDLWDYSIFLIALSSLLFLLVAFRDHRLKRRDLVPVLLAFFFSILFLKYLGNYSYFPFAVLLIISLLAMNGKMEAFIPTLAGLLSLQFIDTDFLLGGVKILLAYLSPIFRINYAVSDTGYLILYHTRTHMPILLDGVKVLLPFYFSLLVAALGIIAILKLDFKTRIRTASTSAAIIVLSFILSAKNLLIDPSTSSFILDNLSALALPLSCILLFSVALPGTTLSKIQKGTFGSRKTWALLISFFFLAVLYITPFEARSNPVIIIDESHSEWEPTWTDYLLTTAKDPVSGTNNYFGLMNIMSCLYNITLIINDPEKKPATSSIDYTLAGEITPEILENISRGRKAVLVLKCVTKPFGRSEIDAIMDFTAQGNGLILIGEHTDIYGMNTNINPISEQLGYRFLSTGVQDIYDTSRGSLTRKGELPPLLARYMTGDQLWETSTSLERLQDREHLFEITTRPSYFAHYRNETAAFFLTREYTTEIILNSLFARHIVWAGATHGKGKVILFTDSTDFNNGDIGIGDHLQIFLAMVEYVSSIQKVDKSLLFLLILAFSLAIIILNRTTAFTAIVLLALLSLAGFALSYPLAHYTTDFPELREDSRMALVKADENYLQDYRSGIFDLEKLMNRYFQKNLTAVMMANPPKEWLGISARVDTLQYAMTDKKADHSL